MAITEIIRTTSVDEAAAHYGLDRGQIRANGLTFEYLEAGSGPLALCLHGFPDSPFTYRHLLLELADAGFHAVAPFIRGFAPTELPPLRTWVHTSVMVADQIALAQALGGGKDTLPVAHDWNAVAAWGALGRAPELFGRGVIINIPPFDIFAENLGTYAQIKKSFYFWYFQMQSIIEDRIRQDEFQFIQDIWGDWSPGYDATEDMVHIRRALADPDHLHAALGYYWGQFDPPRFGSPQWAAQQEAAWGGSVRSRRRADRPGGAGRGHRDRGTAATITAGPGDRRAAGQPGLGGRGGRPPDGRHRRRGGWCCGGRAAR